MSHIPVLLDETLAAMCLRPGAIVVDCTTGLGGHAGEILKRIGPGGKLIGIDFDPANLSSADGLLAAVNARIKYPAEFDLVHDNFAAIDKIISARGISRVDAILADVGVASTQIDDASRGFSYRRPGPLDMRMDPTRGQPAHAMLARLSEQEIADALLELGDESDGPQIARLIVRRRETKPILTTQDLTEIVCRARDFTLERAAGAKLHPAARTFQALRILVNRELANLRRLLQVAPHLLSSSGVLAIITFHSGEDRIVKQHFREAKRADVYREIADEPITATSNEQRQNPRARSAKLRWGRRAET